MQPYKTGDQLYSDPSPNGECSLTWYVLSSANGQDDQTVSTIYCDGCCSWGSLTLSLFFYLLQTRELVTV